jgi:hypothetical protein
MKAGWWWAAGLSLASCGGETGGGDPEPGGDDGTHVVMDDPTGQRPCHCPEASALQIEVDGRDPVLSYASKKHTQPASHRDAVGLCTPANAYAARDCNGTLAEVVACEARGGDPPCFYFAVFEGGSSGGEYVDPSGDPTPLSGSVDEGGDTGSPSGRIVGTVEYSAGDEAGSGSFNLCLLDQASCVP